MCLRYSGDIPAVIHQLLNSNGFSLDEKARNLPKWLWILILILHPREHFLEGPALVLGNLPIFFFATLMEDIHTANSKSFIECTKLLSFIKRLNCGPSEIPDFSLSVLKLTFFFAI